jgi:chromosome segregation ATPase
MNNTRMTKTRRPAGRGSAPNKRPLAQKPRVQARRPAAPSAAAKAALAKMQLRLKTMEKQLAVAGARKAQSESIVTNLKNQLKLTEDRLNAKLNEPAPAAPDGNFDEILEKLKTVEQKLQEKPAADGELNAGLLQLQELKEKIEAVGGAHNESAATTSNIVQEAFGSIFLKLQALEEKAGQQGAQAETLNFILTKLQELGEKAELKNAVSAGQEGDFKPLLNKLNEMERNLSGNGDAAAEQERAMKAMLCKLQEMEEKIEKYADPRVAVQEMANNTVLQKLQDLMYKVDSKDVHVPEDQRTVVDAMFNKLKALESKMAAADTNVISQNMATDFMFEKLKAIEAKLDSGRPAEPHGDSEHHEDVDAAMMDALKALQENL